MVQAYIPARQCSCPYVKSNEQCLLHVNFERFPRADKVFNDAKEVKSCLSPFLSEIVLLPRQRWQWLDVRRKRAEHQGDQKQE